MSNPAAYFDMLSIGERMSDLVEGFSRPELHLFSYAACLLSLYEGQPAAEWGYEFVSAENGLPFSQYIDAAMDVSLGLGQIHPHGALIALSREGRAEVAVLRELEGNKSRERYLAGATDCLLVFNPGNVREAFNYDPAISYLKNGNRRDWVLTKPVVERLYDNFQQLREALAYDARDLSVPLVSWLKYLIQTGRSIHNDSHATN
ncbi:MAG: hypothetical protein NT011_10635 [Kiritimatiellaeota bacterium]|nr:hypothetical protein [Kiritimatiellota bacterium]